MRQKILNLLEKVKKIEKVSKEAADKSQHAANEASGGLGASYSAAGDVEHARNSANLSIQKSKQIKKLADEIESSVNLEEPKVIKPASFVSVEFTDGNKKDLYLVENPVYIPGFNLISPNSLLGISLLGKGVNDYFSYTSGDQIFEGKILEIK